MTSLSKMKSQADEIAKSLKAWERGEAFTHPKLVYSNEADKRSREEQIKASRAKENVTFGIALNNQFIKITIDWSLINETSEVALAAWILKQMRDEDEATHH